MDKMRFIVIGLAVLPGTGWVVQASAPVAKTFAGVATATANHDVLVFADERIGTPHFAIGLRARLNGSTTGFSQAQVTFTGYLEDLPAAP